MPFTHSTTAPYLTCAAVCWLQRVHDELQPLLGLLTAGQLISAHVEELLLWWGEGNELADALVLTSDCSI